MVLTTYGRSSGFCIDPIEKKPLNHFYPGSAILSFGTAGCNLACKFCQNWDISKSKDMDRLLDARQPRPASRIGGRLWRPSRGFHLQRPGDLLPSMRSTPRSPATHAASRPWRSPPATSTRASARVLRVMDAANVDLKAFTDDFYFKLCGGPPAAGARHTRPRITRSRTTTTATSKRMWIKPPKV
jgi:pyruvate formate lyase activating enzyme